MTSFERQLTPLCVDSARALWASFCFRLLNLSTMLPIVRKRVFQEPNGSPTLPVFLYYINNNHGNLSSAYPAAESAEQA